ncbi:MAG: hypothetical protein ABSC50_01665 [Candidatus Bathyarchaeia archaeon]
MEAKPITFCGRLLLGRNAVGKTPTFLRAIAAEERNAVLINDVNTWKIVGERFSHIED